ncbi:MAG: endonuclease III domain-containing protein [Deltaproteobacteria bacterium]|nr:endonuclease III domain-containing protein [Deltaproteobacteria bacterium]
MGQQEEKIRELHQLMEERYGNLKWWPADTAFEMAVGAILTQNTKWQNVEKAIKILKKRGLMKPEALWQAGEEEIEQAIRPAGCYRIKSNRLRNFIEFIMEGYGGSLEKLFNEELKIARKQILSVSGIGNETADCILLYGGNLPVFVVDGYTRRILERHNIISGEKPYEEIQEIFKKALPKNATLFKNYHALFVRTGKDHCRSRARCDGCPLECEGNNVA